MKREFERNDLIETVLREYQSEIGKDFEVYKRHVYRVYYLALSLDDSQVNRKKYAIAAIFHDLGIWTHSFDYLKPSIELASTYLIKNNHHDWMEEISLMIDNHHKISVYQGKHSQIVETFRRADWVDVVMGIKTFGINKKTFQAVKKAYSPQGFHRFLIRESVKYFFKNPLNPLPMFRR